MNDVDCDGNVTPEAEAYWTAYWCEFPTQNDYDYYYCDCDQCKPNRGED